MLNTDDVSAKLIELEDRSRRNKTDLEEIDRCQRKGPRKTKTGQDRDRPRTVVCRLNRFKDKQCILNNVIKLKNTGIFTYEYFSKNTKELRKSLWEQVLGYWKQNKFTCLNYRSIIVRNCNGVS